MKGNKHLLILFLILTGFIYLYAQDERIPTIEELYLEDPIMLIIKEYAYTNDRESKLYALTQVENMINNKQFSGNEEALLSVMQFLSQEGDRHVVIEDNRVINYFPMVRRKSAELIGKLGASASDIEMKRLAKDLLIYILATDPEVMVKSEAAYGLGIIGLNENGDVVDALSSVIRVQTTVAPDNNFAYAVILAIEKIADANNGISDFGAYTTLISIMQGNYNNMVREKALEVLDKIKNY